MLFTIRMPGAHDAACQDTAPLPDTHLLRTSAWRLPAINSSMTSVHRANFITAGLCWVHLQDPSATQIKT